MVFKKLETRGKWCNSIVEECSWNCFTDYCNNNQCRNSKLLPIHKFALGDYMVMFMTPTGYNETTPNTTADNNDSDADPATGNAPLTNLVSRESDQTIDAGIYRPSNNWRLCMERY
ncbi:MAG: hypothetical protein IPP01_10180 [Saprospiraceae bacterium]|nr:hypothetical protein [Saprospiraceae bacterium]